MIISVFGLRDFKGKQYSDYEHVAGVLDTFDNIEQVITGGGQGIESLAIRYATENEIASRIIPPNIQKFGGEAFIKRNREIIEATEVQVIFWDGRDNFYIELIKSIVNLRKMAYVVAV
jgi:hypothetical protein